MFGAIGKAVGKVADEFVETVTDGAKTAVKVCKKIETAFVDPDVREEGLSGAEIYRIFQEGNPEPLRSSAEAWRQSAENYRKAHEALTAALRAAWPDWEGAAATAARAATAPLEQNLVAAEEAATKASTAIGRQADLFDLTKHKLHPLSDNPPADPGPLVAAMLPDQEAKANAYHEKADANRQFYREYIDATRQNLATLPDFTPPQATPAPGDVGTTVSSTAGGGGAGLAPLQPGGVPTDVVRPSSVPGAAPEPGGTTVTAGSTNPTAATPTTPATPTSAAAATRAATEVGRPGQRDAGPGLGVPAGGSEPGRRASGRWTESRGPGTGRELPGGRPTIVAKPPAGAQPTGQPAPAPFGQPGKRDDEERERRRYLVPGPDRHRLFALDEEPPPAVIGLPREKS